MFIFSTIFVLTTSFTDGVRIEHRNEIQSTFPYEVGLPIPFVKLNYPKIDPPLPYTYSGTCCLRFYSWNKYWYSVFLTFITLILISIIIGYINRKFLKK